METVATTQVPDLISSPAVAAKSQLLDMPKRAIFLRLTGFTRISTLILFILSAGYFSFFCTIHVLLYLQPNATWDTPLTLGERFWVLRDGVEYLLNQIHLWSVIPAGIFLPLQFFPATRKRYTKTHRIAGRLLFTLLTIGTITGWKMSMTAFGSTIHTKLYGTILALSCTYGTYQSLVSIKRLQIDRHRIWVLRTWSYAGSILSLRMFLLLTVFLWATFSLQSTSNLNCAQIDYIYQEKYKHNYTLFNQEASSMRQRYPSCLNLTLPAPENIVSVEGRIRFTGKYPEQATALYNTIFGFCGLAGFLFNVIAVETYLYLTNDETERLKRVSAARRKASEKEEGSKVFKQRFMHVVKEEPEYIGVGLMETEEFSRRTEARRRGVVVQKTRVQYTQ